MYSVFVIPYQVDHAVLRQGAALPDTAQGPRVVSAPGHGLGLPNVPAVYACFCAACARSTPAASRGYGVPDTYLSAFLDFQLALPQTTLLFTVADFLTSFSEKFLSVFFSFLNRGLGCSS